LSVPIIYLCVTTTKHVASLPMVVIHVVPIHMHHVVKIAITAALKDIHVLIKVLTSVFYIKISIL